MFRVSSTLSLGLAACRWTAHGSLVASRAADSCSASSIPYPTVFGAEITALVAGVVTDWFGIPGNDVCQINVTLTHPGTGDSVTSFVALPLSGWNGVFQGVGGGGFAAGFLGSSAPIAAAGYACVSTDAGILGASPYTADSWALLSEGNVNQNLLLNFAHRSYHDMTVIGKAVTESYYGNPAKFSYWNGCSTGGRQGLVVAQYYPEDYDGILADAPAIQWNDFTPAQQWPFVVLNNEGYYPLQCEFTAIEAALIAACDGLDGVMDGIIAAPGICNFDPQTLVGQAFTCNTDGTTRKFSKKTATIVEKIWQGATTPQGDFLWYGITKGTNFSTLASTIVTVTGSSAGVAFPISDSWYRGFLYKDLTYNTANMSYAEFSALFHQGHLEYDSIIGSADPDLRTFRQAGGKMITWQGLADNLINPQGTQLYYQKIAALYPQVHNFYRQFFSPGVGHCGGGTGVIPLDPIGQLRAWVENGTAPASLTAASEYPVGARSSYVTNGTSVRFLDLCPYPAVNKYRGSGNTALASSYKCVTGTDWLNFGGPSGSNYSASGGPGWY